MIKADAVLAQMPDDHFSYGDSQGPGQETQARRSYRAWSINGALPIVELHEVCAMPFATCSMPFHDTIG